MKYGKHARGDAGDAARQIAQRRSCAEMLTPLYVVGAAVDTGQMRPAASASRSVGNTTTGRQAVRGAMVPSGGTAYCTR